MTDDVQHRVFQKDQVVEAALMHAAFDGWTRKTLTNAAADCNLPASAVVRLFPRGGDSLLEALDDWIDRQMLAAVDREDLLKMPVRKRVATLVRARLETMASHKEAARRAVIAHGLPGNLPSGGRALWQTVDRIWKAIGLPADADRGFTYYSRRASLAAVLVSTFLFWLDDHSPDNGKTWAFLDRRIDDVMRFGKFTAKFKDLGIIKPPFGSQARRGGAS